jgi:hypothetical protein
MVVTNLTCCEVTVAGGRVEVRVAGELLTLCWKLEGSVVQLCTVG